MELVVSDELHTLRLPKTKREVMPQSIRYTGSRAELAKEFYRLSRCLTGKERDPSGAVDWLLIKVGLVLLGRIKEAYVVKSEGGTDEMGIKWPPLSPVTLALRRKVTGKKSVEKLQSKFKTLKAERAQQVLEQSAKLMAVMSGGNRKDKQHAMYLLEQKRKKGTISQTQYKQIRRVLDGKLTPQKIAETAFAGGFAQILRDTGELLNSFSPGLAESIVRTEPGVIIVGSKKKTATYHNSSLPRKLKKDGQPKLPRRQILPDDQHPVPAAWMAAMAKEFQRGIADPAFWRRFLGDRAA